MIQIYLFGPSPFVDSLLSLSDMHAYVKGVGVEMEDDDPKLYQTLLSSLEEEEVLFHPLAFKARVPEFALFNLYQA